jgi:hypothetical protein
MGAEFNWIVAPVRGATEFCIGERIRPRDIILKIAQHGGFASASPPSPQDDNKFHASCRG